jgi:uroporphyrinogen-III synthase
VFVTSGSVAVQVHEQFALIPQETLVVCIGPRTAADARANGLRVDLVAAERSASSLIDALLAVAAKEAPEADDEW